MWCSNCFFIWFEIFFRFVGKRSFESFAPQSFIVCSSCWLIRTPAKIIGPRTGPRPASSIPIVFIYISPFFVNSKKIALISEIVPMM